MCKKVLSFLLVLFIAFSGLSSFFTEMSHALNTDSISPAISGTTANKYFKAKPAVFEMGDGYAVVWATNFVGISYITYTYNGVKYTVYDQKNGIARTDDTVHVVKVPHEHLSNNSYTVFTKEVTKQTDVSFTFGVTVSAGPIFLKGYSGNDDVKFLVLTDVHANLQDAKKVSKFFTDDPDMIVFNGDIVGEIQTKDQMIETVFAIPGEISGGKYPVIYCRGNHETRGRYASMLLDYFPTKTGEFYFDFEYGPLHGVVIDTGEDKDDGHVEYGGLVNYKEYHEKQEVWLRTLRKSNSAQYTFGIYHIPNISTLANGIDLTDSMSHLGIQFAISGHNHVYSYVASGTYKNILYPTYICGGPVSGYVGTFITFTGNNVKIKSINTSGTVVQDRVSPLSNYVGEIPSSATSENGLNQQTSVNTNSGIRFTAYPSVFETGGDWYNILWATDTSSVGYVQYTYNEKTYQVFDEAGGYRRSYDTVHTVRVPKEHLKNNKYSVASFHMDVHEPYTFKRGASIVSQTYIFEDRSNDKALSIIAIPDIKATSANCERITKAKNAVNALGTSPALIVFGGDNAEGIETKERFVGFLSAASTISGGIHPIVFSRGNAECRGAFASNLIRYLPTVTGEFYFSFEMGGYTFVNLDTGEDKQDSHIEYGGHVFFASQREKQTQFINSLEKGKIIVLNHISILGNYFDCNWESILDEKGAILNLSGHNRSFIINNRAVYNVVCGGYNASTDETVATSFILSDNYAFIMAANNNGKTIYTDTVDLTIGKSLSINSIEPPFVDGKYIISSPEHLMWLSLNTNSTNSFYDKTFVLNNDIDLMLFPFNPIGGNDTVLRDDNTTSNAFSGTFDGNGYSIKNLNIRSNNNNVGLFGFLRNGTVKNLTIESGVVKGSSYTGGIAGFNYGGIIEECFNHSTVYSLSGYKIGGLVGFNAYGASIKRSANFGNVLAYGKDGIVGGIAGQSFTLMNNNISDCYNRGNVFGQTGSVSAGGILGFGGNTKCTIVNCYNAASVNSLGGGGNIMSHYNNAGQIYFENVYFSSGYNGISTAFNKTNDWSTSVGKGNISPTEQSKMQGENMAEMLNKDVFVYIEGLNDNYPVHLSSAKTLLKIVLVENSGLKIENGVITGEKAGCDKGLFREKIANKDGITISYVGTGGVVELRYSDLLLDSAVIMIKGDIDGDGAVSSTDYLKIKSAFLGNISLEEVYFMAADIDQNNTIDTTDYMRIKSYFFGDYQLFN